jgi:hypothetical protein
MSKFLLDPFKFEVGGVSYSVTANTTNINEGQTVQFDILTTGVPNGNTLYWSIEYASNSNSQNTICATASENGTATVVIPTGVKITSVDFASYGQPGGSCGAFTYGGCHASTSQSVVEAYILNQSGPQSIGVPASNGVFGDPCPGSGKWLYIQATGTNVDFVQGLNGSFTLPTNQVEITAKSDLTTEGTETFRLYLRDGNVAGTVLAMSPLITINDTSLTPIISISGPGSANEGDTVNYTVTTTNIADGETLYYNITGISSADITDGTLSGSFTVTSNTATISKTLTNDVSQGEGTEYLRIAIAYPISTEYRAFLVTTINDTSILPPAARATGGTVLNPGNGWRYHIFRATGTLSVPVGGVLDFWINASGGGGGGSAPTTGGGGGGGGGGTIQRSEEYFGPGPYVVTIPGGAAGGSPARGSRAANTTIGPVPAPYYRAFGGGGGGRGAPVPPSGVPSPVSPGLPGGNGGGAGSPTTVPLTGENYGGSNEVPSAPGPGHDGSGGGWSYYSATNAAGGGGSNQFGWTTGVDAGWGGENFSGDGVPGSISWTFIGPDVRPAYNPIGAIPARTGQPIFDDDRVVFGGGGGGGKAPTNSGERFAGNGGEGGGGGGGTAGPRALANGRTNTGGGGGGNPGNGGTGGSGTVLFRYDLSR